MTLPSIAMVAISALAGVASLLCTCSPAAAHGYKFGALEILHPAIVATRPNETASCAHVLIRNAGPGTETFLGASVDSAEDTRLMKVSGGGDLVPSSFPIIIAAGHTLDLHDGWCLLVSGLDHQLDADMGLESGELLFEGAGRLKIEFMIDARSAE